MNAQLHPFSLCFIVTLFFITWMNALVVYIQVGPQVSVLGKEAQEHGLAISLLQRMHMHYNDNAQSTKHLTC